MAHVGDLCIYSPAMGTFKRAITGMRSEISNVSACLTRASIRFSFSFGL